MADSKSVRDVQYDLLRGTTYRVYRLFLRQRKPIGVSGVQRALGLSSPSVAQYHIRKLVAAGLVREEQEGYVIDRVVVDNVIRIRRVSIPIHAGFATFFGITLVLLIVVLRPTTILPEYVLALFVNGAALLVALYELSNTLGVP
jgi:DNA-binding transcriptional ArsR family regulator